MYCVAGKSSPSPIYCTHFIRAASPIKFINNGADELASQELREKNVMDSKSMVQLIGAPSSVLIRNESLPNSYLSKINTDAKQILIDVISAMATGNLNRVTK
jgi:hypothetical protein